MTIKIILLAFMGLLLLIPLEMIKSIIQERLGNSEKVKKEISFQWAGEQTVSGPVLNIPVRVYSSRQDAEPHVNLFHLMPETLDINAIVSTEIRHRSIYQAVVYTSDLNMKGEFDIPPLKTAGRSEILWEEAYFTLGISDNRGLRGNVVMKADTSSIDAVPGLRDEEVFTGGITFPINLKNRAVHIPFSLILKLSGSMGLSFSPVGKLTKTAIQSAWSAPGFNGNFLPSERSIGKDGFSASWLITDLNRNFPQVWSGSSYNPVNDNYGVDFVLQADHYQKSLRSAKYGILFIALTFLALLFTEISIKEKFHVFHYLLVSLALVLFFSLLSALSEQTGFNIAYLISTVATITLITVFLRMLMHNYRPVILLASMLALLYSFIFILLTLNDYAYLAGNIGLFILLTVVMLLSVRLNVFSGNHEADEK